MHEIQNPLNQVEQDVAESNELIGKECCSCFRIFRYSHFRRDSSRQDGRVDQCVYCESQPRLSLAEATAHLKEKNFNSEAVKAQRLAHQQDYKNAVARIGHPMSHGELFSRIKKLFPNLYLTQGRIQGCMALFQIYPGPQPRLNGNSFEYLFFVPEGLMPEFSIWEFDEVRDIAIREKMRGWRTCLLRLIKRGLITETQCNKEFGKAIGPASTVWYRELYQYRNQKLID